MEGLDVRMSGVVCRHGRVEAVRDADLDVVSGQRVALTGTNRSGKTTLLRAVLGLHRHSEGRIPIGQGALCPALPLGLLYGTKRLVRGVAAHRAVAAATAGRRPAAPAAAARPAGGATARAGGARASPGRAGRCGRWAGPPPEPSSACSWWWRPTVTTAGTARPNRPRRPRTHRRRSDGRVRAISRAALPARRRVRTGAPWCRRPRGGRMAGDKGDGGTRKPVRIRRGPATVIGERIPTRPPPRRAGRPGRASTREPGDSRGRLLDEPPGRISPGRGTAPHACNADRTND
jgi:energy-coupling factor transporter ATP-binding protein EcfA2